MEICDVYLGGFQPEPIRCELGIHHECPVHIGTTSEGKAVVFPTDNDEFGK